MFISDKVLFLELHKTGCSHIRNTLQQVLGGTLEGKHNRASISLINNNSNRLCLGSIRNPWEWYVSLWSYGCDRKGGVYYYTAYSQTIPFWGLGWKRSPHLALIRFFSGFLKWIKARKWRKTYTHSGDVSAFRKWLRLMLDGKSLPNFAEGYAASGMSTLVGLMTYRYLWIFCTMSDRHQDFQNLVSIDLVADFERENCFIDRFIRNDRLEEDLINTLIKAGHKVTGEQRCFIHNQEKTNQSSRKKKLELYYDRELINLVHEKEKILIDKFNYRPPILA